MAIITPDLLPGEPGYVSRKDKSAQKKASEKKSREVEKKKEVTIGKIAAGSRAYRIGRPITTPRKEKKFLIWRYGKKIGEILVAQKDTPDEKIELSFVRLGGIGNYRHLIQDADFQLKWATREQELLLTQTDCFSCKKKLSKNAEPHLYHSKLWQKRATLLEEAEKIPFEVVKGKRSIEKGWEQYNAIIESGNKYYMSLQDTALVCATCAKKLNLQH